MSTRSFLISIGLLMICLHQLSGIVNGSPYQLNLKKMFESVGELRTKKDGLTSFTPPDEDVIELEHLKSSAIDSTFIDNKSSADDDNNDGSDGSIIPGSISGSIIVTSNPSLNSDTIGGTAFERAFDTPFEEQIQSQNLPSLEEQLETEAEKDKIQQKQEQTMPIQTATSQPEREEEMIVEHRPPYVQHPNTPPHLNSPPSKVHQPHQQGNEQLMPIDTIVPEAGGTINKSYHGPVRPAFGQLQHQPAASTTTTTTITNQSIQSVDGEDTVDDNLKNSADITSVNSNSDATVSTSLTESVVNSPVEVPLPSSISSSTATAITTTTTIHSPKLEIGSAENHPAHPGHTNMDVRNKPGTNISANTESQTESEIEKEVEKLQIPILLEHSDDDETTNDPVVAELEATKTNIQRRSVNRIPAKSAESLLRNTESSFDMAQYVFWTGDDAGVARAVEEFIQQGLMSRESALKFLKEIRMGIEYLQKSYANRVIPDQKKRDSSSTIKIPLNLAYGTTSSGSIDLTSIPFKHNSNYYTNRQLEQQLEKYLDQQGQMDQQDNFQLSNLNLQRTLDHLPSLMRLQEASSSSSTHNNKDNLDYDEMAGRAKIAEFLYAEYSLEEVIYQLAKVMFSQCLTHESEQSQQALQRLTNFLENEGERGVISPALQKKILDVLLAALSDTLADHPELLATARAKLSHRFLQSGNILDSLKH